MDVITPKIEQHVSGVTVEPTEDSFSSVNPSSIEALKYLGLTDSLYDDDVMEKITEIVEFTGTGDLLPLDVKLGNPYGMSKLDKIYSYVRLMKQSAALQARESLLQEERNKYLDSI